jgi:two-component system, response regulator / RNA-binding antiterminator
MKRVLIIDPQTSRAADAQQYLTDSNYKLVAVAKPTGSLLSLVEQYTADIVVIDYSPEWGEIWDEIHHLDIAQPIPVIVFAEKPEATTIEAAITAGVTSFVADGIHPERLIPVIDVALARFKVMQAIKDELAKTKASLTDRKLVDRAKGILMKQRNCSEDDAYHALRRMAMAQNLKMGEVAQQVINVTQLLTPILNQK